jgi:hypothetical protein
MSVRPLGVFPLALCFVLSACGSGMPEGPAAAKDMLDQRGRLFVPPTVAGGRMDSDSLIWLLGVVGTTAHSFHTLALFIHAWRRAM